MGYSRQRQMILSALNESKTHPTAQDIYEKVRERDSKISLGTVYRNLSLLSKNGTILRIDTKHDRVHYDGDTCPHYHFVCNCCGAVSDLSVIPIDINAQVEKETGGDITGHTLVFYGRCKKCK